MAKSSFARFSSKELQPTDTLLFLICQELKIQRLLYGLRKAGIEDCIFEPQLHKLILKEMGLDHDCERTMERYFRIIEKRCKKIGRDGESVVREERMVYLELMPRRRD
jgi:hypothetical protein